MKYRQDSPFCIQIELTEGCNLYCDFCGLQGIRSKKDKNLKFMTLKIAERIASEISNADWNSRIEFAMHGEPTMNKDFIEIIGVFRKHLPNNQLMITSNGGGLLSDTETKIFNLFEAGLNILALDEYEYVNIVHKIREKLKSYKIEQHFYPQEKDCSPHSRYSKNKKMIVYVKDISIADSGVHASLNNHCGGAAPFNSKGEGKRCAKPFRELSIRWNGKIALCCNDWRGVYKCGDIRKESIKSIWSGKAFNIARKFLYHGMREFAPCKGCDALSYRVGLLPDKKGKTELSRPSSKDRKNISTFNSGISFTKKIKREWE